MTITAVKIHPQDTVATLLEPVAEGEEVTVIGDDGNVVHHLAAREAIALGHKISLAAAETGDDIVKYGEVIGAATRAFTEGSHIHVHNVDSRRVR